jgi:hypothetical protein
VAALLSVRRPEGSSASASESCFPSSRVDAGSGVCPTLSDRTTTTEPGDDTRDRGWVAGLVLAADAGPSSPFPPILSTPLQILASLLRHGFWGEAD